MNIDIREGQVLIDGFAVTQEGVDALLDSTLSELTFLQALAQELIAKADTLRQARRFAEKLCE